MTKPGPGKFEACESLEIAEFLLGIELDGGENDSIGDVETFGFQSLILDANEAPYDLSNRGPDGLQAAYITLEDHYGFYTYVGFDSNEEAKVAWDRIRIEFDELQETYA